MQLIWLIQSIQTTKSIQSIQLAQSIQNCKLSRSTNLPLNFLDFCNPSKCSHSSQSSYLVNLVIQSIQSIQVTQSIQLAQSIQKIANWADQQIQPQILQEFQIFPSFSKLLISNQIYIFYSFQLVHASSESSENVNHVCSPKNVIFFATFLHVPKYYLSDHPQQSSQVFFSENFPISPSTQSDF